MTVDNTQQTVSVIIPTRNRVEVLPRALESILAQTRKADEIIVVDDGSTDDTLRDVSCRYGRQVRILTSPGSGVSAARNHGVRCAKGAWLAFLDSDDAWLPQKLERQWHSLGPSGVIGYTDEIWIRRGKRVNPMKKHAKKGGFIFKHCLPLCVISPSSVIIHRHVFETVGLFDETLPVCEDYDLWLRICARFPVTFLEEPLIVKFAGHSDQLSRCYWGMDRFRIRALEKIVSDNGLEEDNRLAAVAMLIKKLEIYANGARKRGKREEAIICERKRERLLLGVQ